jgi:hypothetical protein
MFEVEPGALRQNARRSSSILTPARTSGVAFAEALLPSDERGLKNGPGALTSPRARMRTTTSGDQSIVA